MQLLIRWSEVYNTSSYRQVKVISQYIFAIALTNALPRHLSAEGRRLFGERGLLGANDA
jgi:hypothetical protein